MLSRRSLFAMFAGAAAAAPAVSRALIEAPVASEPVASAPLALENCTALDAYVGEYIATDWSNRWRLTINSDGIITGLVQVDDSDAFPLPDAKAVICS